MSECNHAIGYWEGVDEARLIDKRTSKYLWEDVLRSPEWPNEVFKFCPRCGAPLEWK